MKPTKIYLVRHAKAVGRGEGLSDEWRYLTPEGRESFCATVKQLRDKVDVARILTSPLVRAVQTAEIMAAVLSFNGPLTVTGELAPGADLGSLSRILSSWSEESLVLVGHEPDLGGMVVAMLGLSGCFTLRKGDIVALAWNRANPTEPARFLWRTVKGKITSRAPETESIPQRYDL